MALISTDRNSMLYETKISSTLFKATKFDIRNKIHKKDYEFVITLLSVVGVPFSKIISKNVLIIIILYYYI